MPGRAFAGGHRAGGGGSDIYPAPYWWPDWRARPCVIVASGPSAGEAPIAQAQGRAYVLTINNSWALAPWADALYASDLAWWQANGGVSQFRGLKVCRHPEAPNIFPDVRFVRMARCNGRWRDEMVLDEPYTIGAGGNSGFQALNLAVRFGAKVIILVGYDMRVDRGTHWHGNHEGGLNNPDAPLVAIWREHLDKAAPSLANASVTVINTSPVSALTAYPKMSFSEALEHASAHTYHAS